MDKLLAIIKEMLIEPKYKNLFSNFESQKVRKLLSLNAYVI